MRKIYKWIFDCGCGQRITFDEKPNRFNRVLIGKKHGVFPITCAKDGREIHAEEFKRINYVAKN